MKKQSFKILIFALLFLSLSCGGRSKAAVSDDNSKSSKKEVVVRNYKKTDIKIECKIKKSYELGDKIEIEYSITPKEVDSVRLFIRGKKVNIMPVDGKWIIPTTHNDKVGNVNFRITAYKDGSQVSRPSSFLLISDKPVKNYKASIVASFKHDRDGYTQGLEFHDGLLYESSGEYGKSYVKSMKFPSMNVVNHTNFDEKIFAEGLTFLNDKLYVLSWKEYKCFVFDPSTLKQIGEFQYNTEGWGLTTDGKYFYMSDGSHYIYVIDPTDFRQIDRLEIMIGENKVTDINELEWIDGEIWANVFLTDNIVRINPKNGVVNSVIDASGLLNSSDYRTDTDVLNGIAYDNKSKKIYVTGKKWPKLYEIKVNEVK